MCTYIIVIGTVEEFLQLMVEIISEAVTKLLPEGGLALIHGQWLTAVTEEYLIKDAIIKLVSTLLYIRRFRRLLFLFREL